MERRKMEYNRWIKIKDDRDCLLCSPMEEDAEEVLKHLIQTSGETENMARYADEITITVQQEGAYLNHLKTSEEASLIVAKMDGKIVASAGFHPVALLEKYRHRAEFGVSVKREYWGMGIGSALLEANIRLAKMAGYEQLELDVVTDNQAAISLYQKFGFEIYGTHKKASRCRGGVYKSLYLMACWL